ncbi:MAG: DUF58 domain-containing protein [Armatimonadetes bacterium]|nr:DUF58 domain-containing protein [Armatimonadota bacterium]
MNRYATFALSIAAMFFLVMAILVDSPPLFYMVMAIMATLAMSAIQAWLAVRGLRFERFVPPAVQVGEPVTVEITIWSERRIVRPLVTIVDGLPKRLIAKGVRPSLPVAPSFDQPIQTRYTFRPMRRGKYRWSGLRVRGTDALGLVNREKSYKTDPVELTVHPAPIPASVDIHPNVGWGSSDLESGRSRGSGLEFSTIREYVTGDPLRYVHWPSSARNNKLMVKEFETGSGVFINFVIQRTQGTEIGHQEASTLEAMCGHALFLAEKYLKIGSAVVFPSFEDPLAGTAHTAARIAEVRDILTEIQADRPERLSDELSSLRRHFTTGCTVVIMIGVQDSQLPEVLLSMPDVHFVCLIYDLDDYRGPVPLASDVRSASDPTYLARLEAAGTEVIVMPRVERLG